MSNEILWPGEIGHSLTTSVPLSPSSPHCLNTPRPITQTHTLFSFFQIKAQNSVAMWGNKNMASIYCTTNLFAGYSSGPNIFGLVVSFEPVVKQAWNVTYDKLRLPFSWARCDRLSFPHQLSWWLCCTTSFCKEQPSAQRGNYDPTFIYHPSPEMSPWHSVNSFIEKAKDTVLSGDWRDC